MASLSGIQETVLLATSGRRKLMNRWLLWDPVPPEWNCSNQTTVLDNCHAFGMKVSSLTQGLLPGLELD